MNYTYRNLFCLLSFLISTITITAQNVGINSTGAAPDPSAMLDISSSSTGALMPRVTLTGSTDITTITSAATSLLVYNTATASDVTPGYYYWDSVKWVRLIETGTPSGADWSLIGNTGTVAGINFIGTTDAQDLVFKTNGVEKMRVLSNGNIGIGTIFPSSPLHVVGNIKNQNDGYGIISNYSYTGGGGSVGPHFIGYAARGTFSSPTHPQLDDVLATFQGRNAIGGTSSAGYSVMAAENHTLVANGSYLKLSTTSNGGGGAVERMRITQDGNVGIGTITPNAKLDVSSTTQGFAMPRMTTVQRLAIATPIAGLQVYDTNLKGFYYFNGVNWDCVTTPAGTVDYFANITSPIGYLECNGQSVSTTVYPELFNAIGYLYGGAGGSFNVPDLRGEFIRGLDNGRNVDNDIARTIGNSQPGTLVWYDSGAPSFTSGTINMNSATDPAARGYVGLDKTNEAIWTNAHITFVATGTAHSPVSTTGPSTFGGAAGDYGVVGTTRPRNVALLPCIKY